MDMLRHVLIDGYDLRTYDTTRTDGRGCTRIAYELRRPDGFLLFSGADFCGSPMNADDSDENLRALLCFLTLRPGDTDAEYFEDYTSEQRAFCEGDAEALSMWSMDDAPAFMDAE